MTINYRQNSFSFFHFHLDLRENFFLLNFFFSWCVRFSSDTEIAALGTKVQPRSVFKKKVATDATRRLSPKIKLTKWEYSLTHKKICEEDGLAILYFGNFTLWQFYAMAILRYGIITIWQFYNLAMLQLGNITAWQYYNLAIWQCVLARLN